MPDEIMVHKVTLSSEKVVLLKKFKIRHQRLAAQAAGSKVTGDNPTATGIAMAEEILKLLVVQVDGKPIAKEKLEDLDSVFEIDEYQELITCMGKFMGNKNVIPKMELVSFGGK